MNNKIECAIGDVELLHEGESMLGAGRRKADSNMNNRTRRLVQELNAVGHPYHPCLDRIVAVGALELDTYDEAPKGV
jgi:hypothetical protein